MNTVAERLEPIQVTVTFLEMKRPPTIYAHPPVNLNVALMRTRDIPLHYYRYLMDRVGRKWHWVNVLRLSDEALEAKIRTPGRDIRVLYLDGAPAGFFDINPLGTDETEIAYFGMMEHATGLGLGRWTSRREPKTAVPLRRPLGAVGAMRRFALDRPVR